MMDQSEAAYTMALNAIMCGTGKPAHVITDPRSQMVSFAEKKREADSQGLADYEDSVEDTMNLDAVAGIRKRQASIDVDFQVATPKAPWRTGFSRKYDKDSQRGHERQTPRGDNTSERDKPPTSDEVLSINRE